MENTSTPKPHSPAVRMFFLWSGLIATVAYRVIIILENIEGPWVKITWYIGTIGFVIYFAHRYQITQLRSKLIEEQKLLEKVDASNLGTDERQSLQYILSTLHSSKEKWTYITIFASSALAFVAGVVLDVA